MLRVAGRAGTSARPPRRSPPPTRWPGASWRPGTTGRSPATPHWPTGSSPPASSPACRWCSGSYPITPASDILHELSKHKNFDVLTFQAEDEIAGIGAALGASYGGALGVTSTSGPGVALKSESIGLAVMTELPLLVIDVQRGGPSTGLPTKTEQADLLQAMYGRNGESPVAVLAPRSPVGLLRGRRSRPPDRADLPHAGDAALRRRDRQRLRAVAHPRRHRHCRTSTADFARPTPASRFRALRPRPADAGPPVRRAGHPGLEHRIGGLEKADGSGNISYDPAQPRPDGPAAAGQDRRHRGARPGGRRPDRRRRAADPRLGQLVRPDRRGLPSGPRAGVSRSRTRSCATSTRSRPTSVRCCAATDRWCCPEMNLGQLALLLRGKYLVDVQSVTKVAGWRSAPTSWSGDRRCARRHAGRQGSRQDASRPTGGHRGRSAGA